MAGETTKTTAATDADAGKARIARLNKGRSRTKLDTHSFAAATELEADDAKIFNIEIPSNAILKDIEVQNDDLDTNACPTLAIDIGVAAGEDFTSITGGTKTKHSKDDIIDADLFVDGVTTLQAASTNWVSLVPDATTNGPGKRTQTIWELLGYDKDPQTFFRLVVVSATASATLAAAANLDIAVTLIED